MYFLTLPCFGALFSDSFPKSDLDPKLCSLTTSYLTFLEGQSYFYLYQCFSNFAGNYPGITEEVCKNRILSPNPPSMEEIWGAAGDFAF